MFTMGVPNDSSEIHIYSNIHDKQIWRFPRVSEDILKTFRELQLI